MYEATTFIRTGLYVRGFGGGIRTGWKKRPRRRDSCGNLVWIYTEQELAEIAEINARAAVGQRDGFIADPQFLKLCVW